MQKVPRGEDQTGSHRAAGIGGTLPASARDVIEAGCLDLMQCAKKISNTDWRKSILEKVAENRNVCEGWETLHEADF